MAREKQAARRRKAQRVRERIIQLQSVWLGELGHLLKTTPKEERKLQESSWL